MMITNDKHCTLTEYYMKLDAENNKFYPTLDKTNKKPCMPIELALEMMRRIPSISGRLLVLNDISLLYAICSEHLDRLDRLKSEYLKKGTHITFICHPHDGLEKELAEFAKDFFNFYNVTLNVVTVPFKDTEQAILRESMNKKFDIIVGNPPYRRGLHLKILEKCLDILTSSGQIIFVHPAEWLVQKRHTSKSKKYMELRNKLNTDANVSITFIDNPWPTIGLYVPLTITYVTFNSNCECQFEDKRAYGYSNLVLNPRSNSIIESLNDITQYGNPKHVSTFLSKIRNHNEGWGQYTKRYVGDWFVNLSSITGNGTTTIKFYDGVNRKIYNMHSLVNSTSLEVTEKPQIARPQGGKTVGNEKCWYSFASKSEAQHALDFITKSKVFRALLATLKIDQNGANSLMGDIPWLDWTQEWTDDNLAKHFNLSSEEMQTVDEIVNAITIK